ncbi:MAG: C40 family peptidase [Mycobacterium sp.]|nr:C40 family peptidase [Mycobacterium sp.]
MDSVPRNTPGGAARIVSLCAAALGAMAAAVLVAAPASAQTISAPGIGELEISDDIPIPQPLAGIAIHKNPTPHFSAPNSFRIAPATGEVAATAARAKVGSTYRSGGVGPDVFDCSGLVQWAYRQAGRMVPRTSYEQLAIGRPISLGELHPGDVVSYYGGSHTALYIGGGQIVHAASEGQGVRVAPVNSMPVLSARRL